KCDRVGHFSMITFVIKWVTFILSFIQAVGRVQYDPYGAVLTSTLPVTLTDRLFSSQGLDSQLGLVYHGDGRYYDPSIAHTLQPDPLGGVPQLPQTLNRYAIPVGVVSPSGLGGQTGYGGGFPWAALGKSTLSESASALIAEGWLGPVAERLVSRAPWYWLSIEVVLRHPRYHIRRPLKNLVGSSVA
ncbi:MAG: RHS repeat-associated core domain-containing protein, partial [Anaerolineae bacterium]|nr:RHS repeat-associated core domain-containing protein [Anaerolineae bacterium]